MNKLDEMEKKLIENSLAINHHDKVKTAKDLGISIEALNKKIVLYSIGTASSIGKVLADPSLSPDDRTAIMSVFGDLKSVPIQKKKKKAQRYYKKYYGKNSEGYKEKYFKLLKEWKRLTD